MKLTEVEDQPGTVRIKDLKYGRAFLYSERGQMIAAVRLQQQGVRSSIVIRIRRLDNYDDDPSQDTLKPNTSVVPIAIEEIRYRNLLS